MNSWLLLHSIDGIGAATFNKLIQKFGTPENVFNADTKELASIPRLPKQVINSLLTKLQKDSYRNLGQIERELARRAFRMLTIQDKDYPTQLKQLKTPPPIIYLYTPPLTTNYSLLTTKRTIAIIGTTTTSPQGMETAFNFAYTLAHHNITIVSGYAKGIDTQAHLGAIKAKGKTIMVIPTGVLNFGVRKELEDVREALFAQSTIISEAFPTAKWTTAQALWRNRITAALSSATLVIEPGSGGGTISTSRHAKLQNKPIFIWSGCGNRQGKVVGMLNLFQHLDVAHLGAKEVSTPESLLALL